MEKILENLILVQDMEMEMGRMLRDFGGGEILIGYPT